MIFDTIGKRLILAAGTLALASGGAIAQGGGYGQQQQQQQQPPQQQQQAPSAEDLSDEKLASFAEAQEKVDSISQDFQRKMQNTEDASEMSEMRQQVNQQMVAAVRDAGLDPAEYNEIARAVRSDPELEKKVEEVK